MENDLRPDKNLMWFATRWWIWLIVLVAFMAVIAWALGWFLLPFEKSSPANVEEQFNYGYTQYQSLEATSRQVCAAEKAVLNAADQSEKSQRNTQLFGYESNYARLAGEYDAWARNAFKGGIIRPPDLPSRAPTLSIMKTQVCGE